MKIAVDARELVGHRTGVGRYLGELLTEWAASGAALGHEWSLYSPETINVPAPFAGEVRVLAGTGGTLWEQWQLPRALAAARPDVLFAPGYTAPLRNRWPIVLTIHDVSFSAHPEWFRYREGARRRTVTRLSAARARVILTDTRFSQSEIVRHLDVPRARVRVVPLGVRQASSTCSRSPGPREPVILFVGSIFTRRHIDALIGAFARYIAPRVADCRLEIVGEDRSHPAVALGRLLERLSRDARQRVTFRSYVDDDTLNALYAAAAVFAFPSEYEGFGLTPLEAMAAGVAPVVLDTPVAREVYGPAARYVRNVRPLEEQLGPALLHLLTDERARQSLLQEAPAVLERYRWDRTAATTLRTLEEAANG